MKLSTSTVQKLVISDVPKLDPITVFLEDLEPRKGKATITCYNESWTSYWGGMGDRTIGEFILSCDDHYLAKNFSNIDHTVYDLDGLADHAKLRIIKDRRAKDLDKERARELFEESDRLEHLERIETLHDLYSSTMADIFGEEWWYRLPEIPNPKYVYLCQIINTVKAALREVTNPIVSQNQPKMTLNGD